jgi:amidase
MTAMNAFYGEWDAWLTPVLRNPTIRIGRHAPTVPFDTVMERATDHVGYTPLQNAVGAPAMSVPLSWDSNGLPIGSHFSAGRGREALLQSLAYELEAARPWAARWPSIRA